MHCFADEFLQANDELEQVFQKYVRIIVNRKTAEKSSESSLLDFGCAIQGKSALNMENPNEALKLDTIDVLTDIFTTSSNINELSTDVLQPTSVLKDVEVLKNRNEKIDVKCGNKLKAFEELDALGECLLKYNLSSVKMNPQFQK